MAGKISNETPGASLIVFAKEMFASAPIVLKKSGVDCVRNIERARRIRQPSSQIDGNDKFPSCDHCGSPLNQGRHHAQAPDWKSSGLERERRQVEECASTTRELHHQ
jgi:hypothetical protein